MSLFENSTDITFEKVYNKALKFLSYRPRSEKEIIKFLSKKKFDSNTISKIIEKLKVQNLVNDSDFTKWWIEQRQTHQPKSKFVIKRELLLKEVEPNLIDELLQNSQDDYKTAIRLFEKRKFRFKDLSDQKTFQKAAQFLQRSGFSWDTVKQVLNNYK